MKKARIKVRKLTCIGTYNFVICIGHKKLMQNMGHPTMWKSEEAAKRNAKKMSKLIGIPFEDGILRTHGC